MINRNKILIVDDEMDDARLLSLRLEKNNYIVSISPDGENAVEQIIFDRPDLIILDIKLPKINGYQLLEWLRTYPEIQNTPVIFSTADASIKLKEKTEEFDANDCVVKPYDSKELLTKMEAILRPNRKAQTKD